jgi:hypothetical protein
MSGLVGTVNGGVALMIKDERLAPNYQAIHRQRDRISERHSATGNAPVGYTSDFWPGNGGFGGDQATDVAVNRAVWSRGLARLAHGVASRVGFVGVTRDQYGAPLGGVTCSLFKTDTRAWIMDIVSDANGNFLLQSVYSPDTHFIVFYKAGSPEVFGTTRQALVGA